MANDVLIGLREAREELLREYVLSGRLEKAELLTKIMDLDEQIEEEEMKSKTV